MHAVALLRNARVAEHDAADVYGKVAVPRQDRNARKFAQQRRERVGDERDGNDENGAALPHVESETL